MRRLTLVLVSCALPLAALGAQQRSVTLEEALRMADGAGARLNEKGLYARAEAWRPFRGVAAHLLWSYYAAMKRRATALEEA